MLENIVKFGRNSLLAGLVGLSVIGCPKKDSPASPGNSNPNPTATRTPIPDPAGTVTTNLNPI